MEDEAVVAAFMDATGCGREDAFDRLASCGGHLGRAINSFFSIDAGPSGGRRRSRSRSPPPSSSDEEDAAVRARPVVPARHRPPRVSRWASETNVVGARSKSSRRRERRRRVRSRHGDDRSRGSGTASASAHTHGGGDREADADGNRTHRRRFREFREDIFSDGEDEEGKETDNSRRRRRLNPTETELTSEGEKKKAAAAADDDSSRHRVRKDAIIVSSSSSDEDDNMLEELDEAPRPPPARNRTFEDLFKVPHDLTFKGRFHAAKAHAARRARWLLANVQSFELPLPSLHQNRDVWGNALVAQCVKDRFVLWQADAGADADDYDADGGVHGVREEAKKVLGYYGIPHDMLPVVVVVDPVTGQAMDVLHGSAACELNDFMVRLGPFTVMKPEIPVMAAKKSTTTVSAGAQQISNTRPATTSTATSAPTSSERAAAGSGQPQAPTATVMRKHQPDAVVAATVTEPAVSVATTPMVTEPGVVAPCTGQPESEEVCKVRVRLADGRVVTKEFGSQCAVAALFAYCRSTLDAGATPPEKPFRLLRFVGRATEEIGDQNASFESLGLHLTTVSVQLG